MKKKQEAGKIKTYTVFFGETIQANLAEKIEKIKWNKNGTVAFDMPLLDCGTRTDNDVKYSVDKIQAGLEDRFVTARLSRNAFWGEGTGHPPKKNYERYVVVDPSKHSHRILRFWWVGEVLWGRVETGLNKHGRNMYNDIKMGSGISLSYRGYGKIIINPRTGAREEQMKHVAWDRVFIGASAPAWNDDLKNASFQVYGETIGFENTGKIFTEGDFGKIASEVPIIKDDVNVYSESVLGIDDATKIIYDSENNILGIMGERTTLKSKVDGELKKELDTYFKV